MRLKHPGSISVVIRFYVGGVGGFRGGTLRNSARGELPGGLKLLWQKSLNLAGYVGRPSAAELRFMPRNPWNYRIEDLFLFSLLFAFLTFVYPFVYRWDASNPSETKCRKHNAVQVNISIPLAFLLPFKLPVIRCNNSELKSVYLGGYCCLP